MSALMKNYAQYDVAFSQGEGSWLYDDKGVKYLDFGCGISVTNLGHCHPVVTGALKTQADRLWHTSNLFPNELPARLADRISRASFGGELFFCNSGAEANEGAIKLARIYNRNTYGGQKPRIITMQDGFHGRTYATLSATAQMKVQKGFEPVAPFFTYVPFNNINAVEAELVKGDVCAVMLELIQGESGVLPADVEYVKALREMTTQYGALLIIDEVQTGYGRTGKLFAYEHYGIIPDIITMAKSMGNGIPIGGVQAQEFVSQYFTAGTHGSTFGGNFLACAAAHAVLDVMLGDDFLEEVTRKGEAFQRMLIDSLVPQGCVVRGKGLMVGVQMPVEANQFIKEALKEKLVLIAGGQKAVRFYPALTASMEELQWGVEIASKVMKRLKGA